MTPGPDRKGGSGAEHTGRVAAGTEHALAVLEFERVLEAVAARAASEAARARLRALRPVADPEPAAAELGRVDAVRRVLGAARPWGMPALPTEAPSALARLALEGAVLEGLELRALGRLLGASSEVRALLDDHAASEPALAPLRDRLVDDRETARRLDSIVDERGQVVDTASRTLASLRSRLKRAHQRIVARLDAFVRDLPARYVVPDASVSVREGRYVVPIRREGRSEVGGIVHGESATGATLFVEPPLALALMNELRELEGEEAREVLRILREETDRLRPSHDALKAAHEALVDFDTLQARARAMVDWDGAVPDLLPPGAETFVVEGGRHPLLIERGEGDVVPFDLVLDPGERAVVVSGPNTGGKSVFLKSLGLIAALAQSGVVPPVRAGTRLPVFAAFFADIGDEQSIAESLSTFSAHLVNLRAIVEGADRGALVLIDEMGTGTDPAEGAALARAVLEHLVERGALTVATSHLGALKRLDAPGSGIVNASLQFDPDRLEPTYQFVKGRPGRSYGLAIARRLGFPAAVLDRAERLRDAGEASVDDLLERLERAEREAAELVRSLERERAEATRLAEELERREAALSAEERTAERRAREEARRLLMDARREVEEAIRAVREARTTEELEAAARDARRRVEAAAGR
ncbi:MAG: endonuclease MutS2, partial [Gemmatimonadetes bacterium]